MTSSPTVGQKALQTGVKTDSHDPAGGSQTEDNVVRLPREWLGPREELVRIGDPDPAVAPPPAPEDFWGEGSSELQSALVGAPGVQPRAGEDSRQPGLPRPRDRRHPRLARTPAVIATATAALVLAVVVISALGGERPGPTRPLVASADGSSSTPKVLQIDARHLSLKPTRAHRVHVPAASRSRARHPRRSHGQGSASGTSTPPALVASSSNSNSSVPYTESASVSSTSSQTVSNAPAQAASAQASQPAFGANGSLGPGHGAANTQ